jgi:sugar lactone lactonase YvrE
MSSDFDSLMAQKYSFDINDEQFQRLDRLRSSDFSLTGSKTSPQWTNEIFGYDFIFQGSGNCSMSNDGTYLYYFDEPNNRLIKFLLSDLSHNSTLNSYDFMHHRFVFVIDDAHTYMYVCYGDFESALLKIDISDMSTVNQVGDPNIGSGNDQFDGPSGITTDGTYLYVCDTGNNRIKKHLCSDLSYVSQIGTFGSGNDQFFYPLGITTDGTYLYVCDTDNSRIKKHLCSDLSYVSQIGTDGSHNDQFVDPFGITTDGTYLYISDSGNNRIKKHLCSDLSYDSQVSTNYHNYEFLDEPREITTDGTYIYVNDTSTGSIVKFMCSNLSYVNELFSLSAKNLPFFLNFFQHDQQACSDGVYVYMIYNNHPDTVCIIKYSASDFSFISYLTAPGFGDDEYLFGSAIEGICTDGSYVYISDTSNNCIKKYHIPDFSYVSRFGTTGSGDDQFDGPSGITTDGTYLYVCDVYNYRIKKHLCSDLSYVSQIGTFGSGNDQFDWEVYTPIKTTIDGTHLYVYDGYNSRIKKLLCSNLSYVSELLIPGSGPGDITIETDGTYLYVSPIRWAIDSDRIKKYSCSDLSHVSDAVQTEHFSTFSYFVANNFLYAACSYGGEENFIAKYSLPDLQFIKSSWKLAPFVFGYDYFDINSIDSDSKYIYFIETKTNRLIKSSLPSGNYICSNYYALGDYNDYLFSPYSFVATDGAHVYVTHANFGFILKLLCSDLSYVSQIGSTGTGNDQFDFPLCITTDGTYLYVCDSGNNRIKKHLCSDLSYVSKIGSTGTGNDQFDFPLCITTDGTYLYVCDYFNSRIKKHLCSDLSYVSQIGSQGTGNDQFNGPSSITTDGTYLYVCDSNNSRIKKHLCSDLSYVSQLNNDDSQFSVIMSYKSKSSPFSAGRMT